ncbi:MAG: hypothetical protein M1840_008699 [Geoglossum simile]|nr:MAG: hypothetical protein M1840_008699 [Geoglossum simile]
MYWAAGITIAAAVLLAGRPCAADGDDQLLAQDVSAGSCPGACQALSSLLQDKVSFRNSSIYNLEEQSYFSAQQSTVLPFCRITPTVAKDVSITVITTHKFKCPFAVKSGGHAPFAGASNIQGGIIIDLSSLKGIQVSSDKKTTQVGAGNRWVDVYGKLDQMGLSVVGGRVSGIGVGGLTIWGGVSFFSGRYGFACDNVRNYQAPLLMNGFLGYVQNAPTNIDASLINIAAYNQPAGIFYILEAMENAKPEPEPDIFQAFRPIETLSSTMRITNLSDLVHELEGVGALGLRQSVWTFTTRASGPLLNTILSTWQTEIGPLKDSLASFIRPQYFQSRSFEGIFYAVTMEWANPNEDGRVLGAAKRIVDKSVVEANRLGLSEKYLYMNYAWIQQDVFSEYGKDNMDRLVKVYDPAGVFTVLQPGYFKLPNQQQIMLADSAWQSAIIVSLIASRVIVPNYSSQTSTTVPLASSTGK